MTSHTKDEDVQIVNIDEVDDEEDSSKQEDDSQKDDGGDLIKKPPKPKKPLMNRIAVRMYKNRWFAAFMGAFALFYLLGGIFLWDFSWAAWWALIVLWITFGLLIKNWWDPALSMMISLILLLAPNVITAKEAASGFGDTLILSLAALYIVAVSIEVTGCLALLNDYFLGNSTNVRISIARLVIPTAIVSGFVNNTPLVAMLIPAVERFCRKVKMAPSKMMIPLSYASIVGNFSIIATSPNLVVIGLTQRLDPTIQFPFFEPGIAGVPIMIVAWIYIIALGPVLLPTRKSPIMDFDKNAKEYTLTVSVAKSSPIVGKTIEDAGLRHLEGLFLVEVQRNATILPAVGSNTTIVEGDTLVFAGDVRKIKELMRIKGITVSTAENQLMKKTPGRILAECCIGWKSKLIGHTVRKSHFRHNYDAAIISVWREGEQLKGKVGDIVLQTGDTLLVLCKPKFIKEHHTINDGDFIWVNPIEDSVIHFDKTKIAIALLVAITLYVLTAIEVVDLMTVSLISAATILITRCVSYEEAIASIDMSVLVVIAASFSTATSLEKTGVATEWAANLLSATEWAGGIGLLAGTYLATTVLTAVLSNVSAAAIMVPVAFSLRGSGSIKALLYIVMHAASADFSTPIGYQTNLMVWGPGGYKFFDYTRFGLPLQVLCMISTVIVCYFAFPDDS